MALYAKPSKKMFGQIAQDAFIAVWAIVWYLIAVAAHSAVLLLAIPARTTADIARGIAEQARTAADQAGKVPAVGQGLRSPFDGMATEVSKLIDTANTQVQLIHNAALIVGIATFLVPVAIAVVMWLPDRIRFAQRNHAARAILHTAGDTQLFALRALTTQPLTELARISHDPVGDWRAGNQVVIAALAELELHDAGIKA